MSAATVHRSPEESTVPAGERVHELFEVRARMRPDAIALRCDGSHLSYGALNRAASGVARRLRSQGVRPGSSVALCVERSPWMVIGLLGVWKAEAAYVPIDPEYPPDRIAQLLRSADVQLVLSRRGLGAGLSFEQRPVIWLDDKPDENNKPTKSPAVDHATNSPDCRPAQLAYLIHTSASTGEPKAVLGSHRGIANRIRWLSQLLPLRADEIVCQRAGLGSVDHVAEIFQPLSMGAAVVMIADAVLHDAAAFANALASHKVTMLSALPGTLRALTRCADASRLKSVRYVFSTGDVLTAELARQVFRAFPCARLFNVFGATEVGADVSCHEVTFDSQVDIADYFHQGASTPGDPGAAMFPATFGMDDRERVTRSGVPLDELRARFEESRIPSRPARPQEYAELLQEQVLPYLVNVSSQSFIGHMTSALPAFIPELCRLIAQLNQNQVKIETSKALTLLERQVLAMMHRLFFQGTDADYGPKCQDASHVFGVVTGGGTLANITALACARNLGLLRLGVTKRELAEQGATAILRQRGFSRPVLLVSRLAHYSIRKAAALLGMGENGIVIVDQDERQKLCVDDLRRRLERCRAQGEFVMAIIGIAGATETGTIDPLAQMARVAAEYGTHFHVDAAWGGALMFSETHQHRLRGIEQADTVTFCVHKQLYAAQGLSLCLFRDPLAAHAHSFQAAYQARSGSYDMGQFSFEGSRPANSLMLHALLHLFAKQGLGGLIDRSMSLTAAFRGLIVSNAEFELVGEPQMNIVNYRYVPAALRGTPHYSIEQHRLISQAVERIQAEQFLAGRTFVSRTSLCSAQYGPEPICVFRVVLASPLTTHADLQRVLLDQILIARQRVELPGEPAGFAPSSLEQATVRLRNGELRIPIGRPISNCRIYLLDELQQQVPVGVVGEICVAGTGLAEGYLGRPSLTALSFVPNPFERGERLYRTGDLGRMREDGALDFIGRADRQIKLRGARIELGEIEAELLRLEGVLDCAVVAVPAGDLDKRLVAYVVPEQSMRRSRRVTEVYLRETLAQVLPAHMLPAQFVFLRRLPLTRHGKVDRRHLPPVEHASVRSPAGARLEGVA